MRAQNKTIRELVTRLTGSISGDAPIDFEKLTQTVIEVGRRDEFDLLLEQGIIPWAVAGTQAAVAAQNGHLAINASALQTHLIIVELVEIMITAGASSYSTYLTIGGVGGASKAAVNRDMRNTIKATASTLPPAMSGLINPITGTSAVSPPANAAQIFKGNATGDSNKALLSPVLLRAESADQLIVQLNTVNVGFDFSASGYVIQTRTRTI